MKTISQARLEPGQEKFTASFFVLFVVTPSLPFPSLPLCQVFGLTGDCTLNTLRTIGLIEVRDRVLMATLPVTELGVPVHHTVVPLAIMSFVSSHDIFACDRLFFLLLHIT